MKRYRTLPRAKAFKVLGLLAVALASQAASAEFVFVKAQGVKFIPDIIRANVGDVVAFRNMAAQALASVPGMWPEGAPELRSETGADYDYPIEREGLYVVKSLPHWGARMGAVIAVGDPAGLAATAAKYETLAASEREAKPAAGLLKKFRERMGLK